ncbi:MAG TPA: TIGR03118 family protein [Pyrinomonadaceae bacterium]|nr:TIGR03118 family protein [Pyrinomonadaceae bacterium]
MPHLSSANRRGSSLTAVVLSVVLGSLAMLTPPSSARRRGADDARAATNRAAQDAPGNAYAQTNHLSDLPGFAYVEDKRLVNPWGLALNSTSPLIMVYNGSGLVVYHRVGPMPPVHFPFVNRVPGGLPTAVAVNTSGDFPVNSFGRTAPATYIFASLNGKISAGSSQLFDSAVEEKASTEGAAYTGLAVGNNGSGNFIYAADFARRRIDVFDGDFQNVSLGDFADPTLPPDFAPFNVQNLGSKLYVTYAKVGPDGRRVDGAGHGVVSTFDFDGNFTGRLITGGVLNAPWGLAVAPAGFGPFGGALLVGNRGRGGPSLNAFDPETGAFLGSLKGESGEPVELDGLWGIVFGNGVAGGDPGSLYFAAGLDEERHGLIGSLKPAASPAASLVQFSATEYVADEDGPALNVTVTRTGRVDTPAAVNYATLDGSARQKNDYGITLGALRFAPGETSKTFKVLLVNDRTVEGAETLKLVLSNPSGAGLGSRDAATLTIRDDDTTATAVNPIDDAEFFVRQHYLDFLNREPDAAGLAFWTNQIRECESRPETERARCREERRIHVSAAFFLSTEFQRTGLLVYFTHRAAFGASVLYARFMRDAQAVRQGVVIGQPGAEERLDANTRAFFDDFVANPEFVAFYGARSNEAYVDTLLLFAGTTAVFRRIFDAELSSAQVVPPANSPATGRSVLVQGRDFFTARVSLNLSGLTSPQTAAHIHGPAAPGEEGPVIVTLPNGPLNDFPVRLTTFNQVLDLEAGRLYVDVHTSAFPGGEVRGQYPPQSAFRDRLVARLNGGAETRATVLRKVAEDPELRRIAFNEGFARMQYFGYLRRNTDDPPDTNSDGYFFWVNKLAAFDGDFIRAEMVKAFITSGEYRGRFAPQ